MNTDRNQGNPFLHGSQQLYGVDDTGGMAAVPLGAPGVPQPAAAAALGAGPGGMAMYPNMVGAAAAQGGAAPQYVMVSAGPARGLGQQHVVISLSGALCACAIYKIVLYALLLQHARGKAGNPGCVHACLLGACCNKVGGEP